MADAVDAVPAEFVPIRFRVGFYSDDAGKNLVASGSFSEVTGLEATVAPKALREGGRNYGDVQLSGNVTFAPVVLKRGFTEQGDLWSWFESTTRLANYAVRYTGVVEVFRPWRDLRQPADFRIWLYRVLPTKFKAPDLSATASQVAVEELQLVHEGLVVERRE
jgi:phage tail-like protein